MVFDGKLSVGAPPPEKMNFRKYCLWPWPLNLWP